MGNTEPMESAQSLWRNRRVQRSAGFVFIVLALFAFGLYSRTNWPTAGNAHVETVSDVTTYPTSSNAGRPNNPPNESPGQKTTDEPLHNSDVSEYDPKNMPKIPTTHGQNKNPISTSVTALNPKRVALIIETRPLPVLPALLSQFILSVPPAWVVRMVGSTDAFEVVKESASLSRQIETGKLILTDLPDSYPVDNNEALSATLTNLTFYSEFLAPAEWLLIFQTDSIICSASNQSLDDWVAKDYDWVGAPWNNESAGGNGGLSLRKVASIIKVLQKESRQANDATWEDRWLCDRLPNLAPAYVEKAFSVESMYYERPLGYHLRGSGKLADPGIWSNNTRKRQIFNYCPEVKIILGNMGLEPASDKDDEKNENDPQRSALAAVFKAAVTQSVKSSRTPEVSTSTLMSTARTGVSVTTTTTETSPAVSLETDRRASSMA